MNEIFFNMAKDEAVLCLFESRTANVQREIRFHCKDEPIEIASSRILQLEKDTAPWTRNISVIQETSPVLKDAQAFFRISSERKKDTRISQCLICWSSW